MQHASTLHRALENCVTDVGELPWRKLFEFSYETLRVPKAECTNEKLATIVNRNLHSFDLTSTRLPDTKPLKKKQRTAHELLKTAVEAKVQDGEIRGAYRLLSSDDVIAPQNVVATLHALREKHPAASNLPFPIQQTSLPPPHLTETELLRAVKSFPTGSSGGLDG